MKVSDYVAEFLAHAGCTHVFGYPGGAVTHLLDSLYKTPGIRFVGTCHEQGAAFAAEGYARLKGAPGAAMATSGPGATNLLTGVGSAYFDSIPVLYLTGQVNTYEYKEDRNVRQLGFQETDIVSVAKPITKYAVRVTDPSRIRFELEKAVSVAVSGRPGPVLLDLPMDVQRAEVEPEKLEGFPEEAPALPVPDVDPIVGLLSRSERPVLLAGGGIRLSGAAERFREIAGKLNVPVVSSLMGLDVCGGENFFGMIGSYGCRCANYIAANADLILAVGTRLDTRQTGTVPESFARGATLVRVDVDAGELEHRIRPDELQIRSDAKVFLEHLSERLDEVRPAAEEWLEAAREYRRRYQPGAETGAFGPNRLLEHLSSFLGPDDAVCLDVGQNQMWAAQSLRLSGQRLLVCGGMGAMGFSLPCAIGAWYAGCPGTVYAITGDGGMQMNLQELGVLSRERIPVKVIVLNNRCLGMIRQFQDLYFEGRRRATVEDYRAPDFCRIAAAYGIPALRAEDDPGGVRELLRSPGPALIEFSLPQTTRVLPKLEVDRPVEEQDPPLPREEFLRNMIVKPYEPKTADPPAAVRGGDRHSD